MRDIKGFEGLYAVTSDGQVWSYPKPRSSKHGKWLKPQRHPFGYLKYPLSSSPNVKHRVYAHRLVAQAYIPNPLNKPEVNHIDGDPTNNSVENLEWCTSRENKIYTVLSGRFKMGGFIKQKLGRQQVSEIREAYSKGNVTQAELAKRYRVSGTTVSCIINWKRWKR